MLALSSSARTLFTIAGAALIISSGAASAASAKPPKREVVKVSRFAFPDASSKMCMPRTDSETGKTVTLCLTREGWEAQGVTIVVK